MVEEIHGCACQTLWVSEMKKSVCCPKCGEEIAELLEAGEIEDRKSRALAVVWMIHFGWQIKDIATVLGVSVAVVNKDWSKAFKEYGGLCDFFGWRLQKDGRRKLKWFMRGGELYTVRSEKWELDDLGPHATADGYDESGRFCWANRKIIADLSDWQRGGFVWELSKPC